VVVQDAHMPRAKSLLIADMDSTMIQCECIDELADYAGIKPQVAAITEAAMRGELDFAAALDARVALLEGMEASVIDRCRAERVRLMPGAKILVATMAAKKIYSDPTMVAFESLYVPDNGDLSPSYAPFVGTLPPTTERGFRSGGFAVPADLTRADYRASWAKMVALLGKMHAAGVPIVAGTDGSGIELIHELEIYQQAGFTPAAALAAATIVPARLVGQDKHTGSIAVGKTADLVLVEGDPSVRLADLRQTRVVMLDGKMLDADALRAAEGYAGRPK